MEKEDLLNVQMTDDISDKEEKQLRPCCACPETRKIRDECIMNKGEDLCRKEIENHIKCLKSLGFDVSK